MKMKQKGKAATLVFGSRSFYSLRIRQISQHWLALQGMGERHLATIIARHLERHGDAVIKLLRFNGPATLALESFSVPKATEDLLADLEADLFRLMVLGAYSQREWKALQLATFSKGPVWDALSQFAINLPSRVLAGLRVQLNELKKAPFWQSIAALSKKKMGDVIEQGIRDGKSNREIAKAIKDATGGRIARKRAETISRTESTGCLNAGHAEALAELAEHDAGTTKQWSAVIDQFTRPSHVQLNGQQVPVNALFSNGGRWPCDYKLPAEERVNCRCVLISGDL